MIDFIYLKFITSAPNFMNRNFIDLEMNKQEHNRENFADPTASHQLVECKDFFITQKNTKVAARGLGEKSALLNSYFLEYLKGYNIPTAFVKLADKKILQYLKNTEFPFSVKVLNGADARTAKIFSVKPGSPLDLPVQEYHYGEAKDSVVSESHLVSFNLCTYDELKMINRLCSKINAIIRSFFERRNASLVELTCKFGKFESKIYLLGDFSPVSLKIINNISDEKLPDSYKIETFAQMKKYSDFLLKLISRE
jgi:phosphoribosylaminoimidazole-succinocarboxamide synthase